MRFVTILWLVIVSLANISIAHGDEISDAFSAARSGELEVIKSLVASNPDIISAREQDGSTLLHAIARMKSFNVQLNSNATGTANRVASDAFSQVAIFLIDNGADINARDNKGITALHWAIGNENNSLAMLLVQNGCDTNAAVTNDQGLNGATPLHFAAGYGNLDVMEVLLKHGGDPKTRTAKGQTPLDLAKQYKHEKIVALLEKVSK